MYVVFSSTTKHPNQTTRLCVVSLSTIFAGQMTLFWFDLQKSWIIYIRQTVTWESKYAWKRCHLQKYSITRAQGALRLVHLVGGLISWLVLGYFENWVHCKWVSYFVGYCNSVGYMLWELFDFREQDTDV